MRDPGPPDLPPRSRDVARRSLQSMGWLAISGGGQAVLQVGLLVVLARLISPQAFGVVAAASVVVALTAVFAEAGIGPALVQREAITDRHIRVGITFQVAVSLALWGVLASGSGTIAALFRMEELAAVVPVLSSVVVIRGLSLGDFLLQRRLDFRRLAVVELGSWAVGYGAVAIVLALAGYGLWAIVVGTITQAGLRTLLLWAAAPHAVRPLWDGTLLLQLLSFGGGYTLGWWANFAARQGDNVVVGRWLGADALGLYTRAYGLMRYPATLLGAIVSRVLFPAMAAIQDDRDRLRRTYLRSVGLIAIIVLPVSAVAALTSTELVTVLLGTRWLGLRDAFNVMVLGMLFRTSYKLSDSVASATGHVYQRAGRQLAYAAMIVVGALIGQHAGIRGVAWGILLALLGNFLLMAQLSLRITAGRWRSFAAAHVPGVVLAVAVGIPVWLTTGALRSAGAGAPAVLVASAVVAIAVAMSAVRAAPRSAPGRNLARPLSGVIAYVRPGSRGSRTLRRLLGAWYVDVPAGMETPP